MANTADFAQLRLHGWAMPQEDAASISALRLHGWGMPAADAAAVSALRLHAWGLAPADAAAVATVHAHLWILPPPPVDFTAVAITTTAPQISLATAGVPSGGARRAAQIIG